MPLSCSTCQDGSTNPSSLSGCCRRRSNRLCRAAFFVTCACTKALCIQTSRYVFTYGIRIWAVSSQTYAETLTCRAVLRLLREGGCMYICRCTSPCRSLCLSIHPFIYPPICMRVCICRHMAVQSCIYRGSDVHVPARPPPRPSGQEGLSISRAHFQLSSRRPEAATCWPACRRRL